MDNETTAPTVAEGDQILYRVEDAGRILDGGLYLQPGEPLTVGADVPVALAARLVEERVCGVVDPTPASAAVAPAQQPGPAPKPAVIALGGPVGALSPAGVGDPAANTADS